MKKVPVILALLTACLFSFSFVYAQTSISGDALCGSSTTTACNFTHLKSLVKGVMYFIIGLGLPLLIVIIAYRFIMAWFAAAQGQTGTYKEATKKAAQSILGFLILIALFGGVLTVALEYLGATDPVVKLLKLISSSLVETAHAQDVPLLPSPIKDTNLYDFLLKILAMVMRFFIYPALIVMWVVTGFSFILAQGKPDALSKAKKLIIAATISTFVVVMIQAFLIAANGTVDQILQKGQANATSTGQQVSPMICPDGVTKYYDASDRKLCPSFLCPDGKTIYYNQSDAKFCKYASPGSNGQTSCIINGKQGVEGVDGNCYPSQGGGTNAADYCNGKLTGTQCSIVSSSGTVPGICKKDTVVGCFKATQGDACLTTGDKEGTMDSSLTCVENTVTPTTTVTAPEGDYFSYDVRSNNFTITQKQQGITEDVVRHNAVWNAIKRGSTSGALNKIRLLRIYYSTGSTSSKGDPILMETIFLDQPDETYTLAVHIDQFLSSNGILNEKLLQDTAIHETMHILAFSSSQIDSKLYDITNTGTCKTFVMSWRKDRSYACFNENSYLNSFAKLHYNMGDNPLKLMLLLQPKGTTDAFVSSYAKDNISEDLAESWKQFVLSSRPVGSTTAEQKVLFFYQFSELISLRDSIRSTLK